MRLGTSGPECGALWRTAWEVFVVVCEEGSRLHTCTHQCEIVEEWRDDPACQSAGPDDRLMKLMICAARPPIR